MPHSQKESSGRRSSSHKSKFYFAYSQELASDSPRTFTTFQYLINKEKDSRQLTTKLVGVPELKSFQKDAIIGVFMKISGNTFNVLNTVEILPGHHLFIKRPVDGIGNVIVEDIKNNGGILKKVLARKISATTEMQPESSLPEYSIVLRFIIYNKEARQYEAHETLMPEYMPTPYRVETSSGGNVIRAFDLTQAPTVGAKSVDLPPHISRSREGKHYESDNGVRTKFVNLDPAGLTRNTFIIVKFTPDLTFEVLQTVPFRGDENFVVDCVNSDGKPRTLDMFCVNNSKIMRTQSLNSSLDDLKYRPGMILLKIMSVDQSGQLLIIDTLFFGWKVKDINLRFTNVDRQTGTMMLLNTVPIPRSKLIMLKEQAGKKIRKMSEETGIPVDITKSIPDSKRAHHHRRMTYDPSMLPKKSAPKKAEKPKKSTTAAKKAVKAEKPKKPAPKKAEKPKQKPKVIEEYYYYDDEEEDEVEYRNITLVVDEDGNIVTDDGAAGGKNIDDVLKKMNVARDNVKVVEEDN